MITTTALKEYTLKDLAQMAKKRGISGWHSMRKGDLIDALVRDAKRVARKKTPARPAGRSAGRSQPASKSRVSRTKSGAPSSGRTGTSGAGSPGRSTGASSAKRGTTKVSSVKGTTAKTPSAKATGRAKATVSRVAKKIQRAHKQQEELKDLSRAVGPTGQVAPAAPATAIVNNDAAPAGRDRVVLMVRDPYWLHAHWDLSGRAIHRARAAMAEHWHTARPILRLLEVATGPTTNTSEVHVRDIEIHGGVTNWYIDVAEPPRGFRVEIGYLSGSDRFHCIARSNSVMTPEPGTCDSLDHNWADVAKDCERIFALSGGYSKEQATDELQEVLEERLRRPVGAPMAVRYGVGGDAGGNGGQTLPFDVDAEMIIYGSTRADAHVTLAGEPIKLREDGTFTIRMRLPDRRQVLPVTSSTRDGSTQQTVILAIERNTKVMEPVLRDNVTQL